MGEGDSHFRLLLPVIVPMQMCLPLQQQQQQHRGLQE